MDIEKWLKTKADGARKAESVKSLCPEADSEGLIAEFKRKMEHPHDRA